VDWQRIALWACGLFMASIVVGGLLCYVYGVLVK
jgi:hypothetical protein